MWVFTVRYRSAVRDMNAPSLSGLACIYYSIGANWQGLFLICGLISSLLTAPKMPCDRMLFSITCTQRRYEAFICIAPISLLLLLVNCWMQVQAGVELSGSLAGSRGISTSGSAGRRCSTEAQGGNTSVWQTRSDMHWQSCAGIEECLQIKSEWIDIAVCRENCPFSLCLALTSPSFLYAEAGKGCVCGNRRTRAETGSQEC